MSSRPEDAAHSLAVAQAANDVAVTCIEMGMLDEALAMLEESLTMRRRHDPCFDTPDIAQGVGCLGTIVPPWGQALHAFLCYCVT